MRGPRPAAAEAEREALLEYAKNIKATKIGVLHDAGYGNVVLAELKPMADKYGVKLVAIEKFDGTDVAVFNIDGEFYGKASQMARVELAAGPHRIEVVRPGYRTEETEVQVDGDTRKVVVRLERR